jgi:hypothetical protein
LIIEKIKELAEDWVAALQHDEEEQSGPVRPNAQPA